MSTTNGVPEHALSWLERDVATWLHIVADQYFGGDFELALNEMLRIPMAMSAAPDDPWAAITAEMLAKERGQRIQKGEAPPS